MRLEGIHHITAITGDAPRNVDFYTRVLGLRMVKKTVNQDEPSVYHLFYADEKGSPGADITFFEFPGAARGRAGAGMVHRIGWRVGSPEALEFWAERLRAAGAEPDRNGARLRFADPEGLEHELIVAENVRATERVFHIVPREGARLDALAGNVRCPPGVTGLTTTLRGRTTVLDGAGTVTEIIE